MANKKTYSKDLELNRSNYYGNEANWHLMSVSQFKNFQQCEARTMAELKKEWERPTDNTALLVGNYVHSFFESEEEHENFKEENKENMFKGPTVAEIKKTLDQFDIDYKKSAKKDDLIKVAEENNVMLSRGDMLSTFNIGDQMIERVKKDALFNHLWQGESEVIIAEEMFGVMWKARIDLLNVEKGYFVDLKTSQDLNKRFWNKRYGGWVSFVEEYGYTIQMAMYEKMLEKRYGKPFKGIIYAVSKQTPSDIGAIKVEQRKLDFELEFVESEIEHVMKVKNGEEKPTMCGKCEYCREKKQLFNFIGTDDLID